MPDKSFEKNVQGKLGGFGLAPTDKVWMRVEEELHKKNKRRRGIIWLFFGLMLATGAAYLISRPTFQSADQPGSLVATTPSDGKSLRAEPLPDSGTTHYAQAEPQRPEVANQQKNEHQKNERSSGRQLSGDQSISQRQKNAAPLLPQGNLTDQKDIAGQQLPAVPSQDQWMKEDGGQSDQSSALTELKKSASVNDSTVKEELISPAESEKTANPAAVAKTNEPVSPSADDSLMSDQSQPTEKFKKKRNYQVGVRIGAGITALPDKLLGSGKKSVMADNFAPGNGFPGLPPLNYTYDQQQSYGFEAGVWIKTAINKKSAVSAGIDYTYLSTITRTGAISTIGASVFNGYQSVSLNSYYLPGQLGKYRNQYHLLQLPLEYAITWRAQSKLPFSISAGIKPGLLLSSNALLNDSSGILYSDRSNYNKFQFGISTGLSVRLFNRSKLPLDFGPVAQYQLTNSYRKNTGYSGHLFYLGLRASVPIFNISRPQR